MKKFWIKVFFVISFPYLLGCNGNSTSGLNNETVTSRNDIKRIVSMGVGLNFNNMTGGSVEMALNPTTHLPAIVYYDRSQQVVPGAPAGALKFAYMDIVGNWNIEIIDANYGTGACGSATAYCVGAQNVASTNFPQIYDIAFIPATGSLDSYPVVVYAHGNSAASGKRIRAAFRNPSSGIWSIEDAVPPSGIPTGIAVATIHHPIKGLNVVVDSLGQPHVYFGVYETTLNNSRLKYVMKTGGSWTAISNVTPSGYNFVSGSPTIAATTGVVQAEAVMCPTNDLAVLTVATTDNSPSGSNQPWILKCSTVNTAGTCTAWDALDLITGCSGLCLTGTAMTAATTNAGARSTLDLDPTTNKILFGMFSTAVPATQIVTGVQSSTDDCSNLTTTAWTTQAYPTANQGVNGVALTASTANSINSNTPQAILFSTTASGAAIQLHKTNLSPFSSAWTAANTVTVETAAASFAGSVKFDSTTLTTWGAFSVTTAGTSGAVGNDVKVLSTYESDISSTGLVSHSFVDQSLGIFPSTAVPVLDANIASDGTVGYAYFFTESGAAPGPNSHLYYGIKGGSQSNPSFGERLVYNSTQGATTFLIGRHPSLDFDSTSNPVISFQDSATATQGLLMLARSFNQGAHFSVEKVDGAATGNNVGSFSSVDVRSDDAIGISYFDATNNNLKFAKKSANGSWRRFAVDGPTGSCAAATSAGSYSKFLWSPSGKAIIVYQGTSGGVKYLKMAMGTPDSADLNYTWSCLTLDSTGQGGNNRGEGIDFKLSNSGKPHVVHQDSTAARIRYVTCGSDVETCFATGAAAFTDDIVESVGSIAVNSSKPTISIDSNDNIYIAYYSAADLGLYMKVKSHDSAEDFQFIQSEAIEVPIEGTLFTNPAGQYAVMLTNSANGPMIIYRSYENWLKYFSRE